MNSIRRILFLIAFLLFSVDCRGEEIQSLRCVEYFSTGAKENADADDNTLDYETEATASASKGVKTCTPDTNSCFSVWRTDENGAKVIEVQGCWQTIGKESFCSEKQCIGRKHKSSQRAHLFCCCKSMLCNANMTEDTTINAVLDRTAVPQDESHAEQSLLAAMQEQELLIIVCVIIAPLIASILYIVCCRRTGKSNAETTAIAAPNPKYCADLLNVDNLKLCSMIGQGKYGTVWKGMVNEQLVAVKIFPAKHKDYFTNERDIYTLPLMENQYFLEYFGCDERRTMDDNIEYLLVLSLAPLGSLQEWLTDNTSTFNVFINMARSMAKGLSHLHSELTVGALAKPSVCHRDLNSRNILVKCDLSCCISDFGFALKTYGSRYEWKGEVALAEQRSINEVGTVRYFAPELLEGAVNLRDCEASLKQADIYALGLVLWELCTRCHDWYAPGQTTPSYKLPYEKEVGKTPSFEQMQMLVSRQKVRPQFPTGWGGDAAAKIARDTVDDCVDHDAEARLTAVCVEERIRAISVLRPHSIILSPTAQRSVSDKQFNNNPALVHELKDRTGRLTGSESVSDSLSTSDSFCTNHEADFATVNAREAKTKSWQGVRSIIPKRKIDENDEKSILVEDQRNSLANRETSPPAISIEDESVPIKAKHLPQIRPSVLNLNVSHTSLLQSDPNSPQSARNCQSMFKYQPGDASNQPFAIVDESRRDRRDRLKPCIVVSKSANAVKSLQSSDVAVDEWKLKRQRSLEVFRDVFGVKGSPERLRDPSERIKTPGDVPKSVRKIRASKTLSLYDDRMMNANLSSGGNSL